MADEFYYSGWWVNWAKGPILGLTLTISARNGGLLISFLTMFTRLAGNHMWGIIRFLLHQFRATPEPQDGLYHQQQTVLRTATSQSQALWKMTMLAWVWGSNAERAKRRSLPMMTLIILHLSTFLLAGLFTSRVASSSNDALAKPATCGYWPEPDSITVDNRSNNVNEYNAFTRNNRGVMQRSSSYEKTCYYDIGSGNACNVYTVQLINSTVNQNYSCPLPNSSCWHDMYNLQLDTGYINSNTHLGINTRDEDSVSYRKITTCAPFDALPWESDFHKGPANILPGDTGRYLYLGPEIGAESDTGDEAATVFLSNYSLYFPTQAYDLSWAESVLDDKKQSFFTPNTTFVKQTDEDILLLFLINNALFAEPVMDFWFYSNSTVVNPGALKGTYYGTDQWPSTMFCSEQHQFCNPNTQDEGIRCTPLTGRAVTRMALESDRGQSIGLTSLQWATTYRLLQNINEFTLSAALRSLGSPSMLAQDNLDTLDYNQGFLSDVLYNFQWQEEIMNWHNATLANMQRWVMDYVYGPIFEFDWQYIVPPTTPEERSMCASQRARFDTAMSFNGLGVLTILVVGSVIIVTNLCLPFVTGIAQRYLKKGTYRRMEWILDDTLQLQRMAYEGAGQGTWRRKESVVPLTLRGEKFGLPDMAMSQLGIATEYHFLAPKS